MEESANSSGISTNSSLSDSASFNGMMGKKSTSSSDGRKNKFFSFMVFALVILTDKPLEKGLSAILFYSANINARGRPTAKSSYPDSYCWSTGSIGFPTQPLGICIFNNAARVAAISVM